jgi:hypothetical protein
VTDLIERYIHDVTRRLPEADRTDVATELRTNIWDTLPEDPNSNQVRESLTTLGDPGTLAERYRNEQRYLISPAIFDQYTTTLKWVLPLVGVVFMIGGGMTSAFTQLASGTTDIPAPTIASITSSVIASSLVAGFTAVALAAVFVTIGFVITDRRQTSRTWTPDSLPRITSDDSAIPLSNGVSGLVTALMFTTATVWLCATDRFPAFIFSTERDNVVPMLDARFMDLAIPAIIVLGASSATDAIMRIIWRRWSLPVCLTTVAGNIVILTAWTYLFTRPQIFSDQFTDIVAGPGQTLTFTDWPVIVLIILAALILITVVGNTATAVLRTKRYRHSSVNNEM